MSTIKTTNITHGSNSGTSNLVLTDTGNVTVGADLIATKQNGCQRIVLEQFWTPCDGSTIATANGNITVPNVTASLDVGESWTDVTGSAITYTPPTGTTQVIYGFQFVYIGHDSTGFTSFRLSLAGTEVTDARRHEHTTGGSELARTVNYQWGFNIGDTANAATGRVASWSSGKEIKIEAYDYSSGHDCFLHQLRYWENADVTDFVTKPCVGITAIG